MATMRSQAITKLGVEHLFWELHIRHLHRLSSPAKGAGACAVIFTWDVEDFVEASLVISLQAQETHLNQLSSSSGQRHLLSVAAY